MVMDIVDKLSVASLLVATLFALAKQKLFTPLRIENAHGTVTFQREKV